MTASESFMWGTFFGLALACLALLILSIGYAMGKETKKQ